MAIDFSEAVLFDEPFQEAVAAFLEKQVVSREEFDRLAAEMRARAFTAAWVYGADELNTVYEAVLKALEAGASYEEFAALAEDLLEKPWHRETVFRTNILSAYGRGHWDQAQAAREMRPYARYSAVMDGRTRPSHAALHGLVYPLDHPFWKLYWPPWDYNCRCAAITLSREEVEAEGLEVRTGWEGVPPPSRNFQSPAAGTRWEPDYGKYPAPLGEALRGKVKAIYD